MPTACSFTIAVRTRPSSGSLAAGSAVIIRTKRTTRSPTSSRGPARMSGSAEEGSSGSRMAATNTPSLVSK